MTTSVLVAGATGDLGQRIVRDLLTHDTRIRVLTRPGNGTAAALYGANDRIDIVTAAYTDPAALTTAVTGADVRRARLEHGARRARCALSGPGLGHAVIREHFRRVGPIAARGQRPLR